ncbi:MAG: 16S rRNA (guanine(966)-N(2))-methyltransferase RsmD [Nitrosomonadaceae bacterium]|nr:16S rRNA (guanine(966)-N(2))-methyltransferase RsmD [Nitrosomonadaceae bacterium]
MPLTQNKIRVIGGKWRGHVISFPSNVALRPTPNRVRETVFNWLGQDMSGKVCLDLFAGSGAMGIEAASRGSEHVVMVESNRKVYGSLQSSLQKLRANQVELVMMDALKFITFNQLFFDVIFLDPPYQLRLLHKMLNLLSSHVTQDSLIYLEAGNSFKPNKDWLVWRSSQAGQVHYQLLKYDKN